MDLQPNPAAPARSASVADAPQAGSAPANAAPRFSPFLRASAALHVGAAGLALLQPAAWPWALGAVVANHGLITAAGLWPRSTLLGPNITRLPAAAAARGEWAITLDDGPDPALTPKVLDLLDAAGQRATFFCIARRAAEQPALVRQIIARGHSLQNHSFAHAHTFSMLGPRAMAAEVRRAQQTLADITGELPRFFRAPAGLRNPFLQPVLAEQGLQLASWTRRGFDTRQRQPQAVLTRLLNGLAAGDLLLLHDGHAAVGADGQPVVLTVLPALLQATAAAGLRAVTLPQAWATEAASAAVTATAARVSA